MAHAAPSPGFRPPVTLSPNESVVLPPRQRLRGRAWIALLALLLLAFEPSLRVARASNAETAQTETEYGIKAKCLGLFVTNYIKWPETAFKAKDAPFVIAILGKDPFGKLLSELLKGKKVAEHPIKIVNFPDVEKLQECQLLFVPSASEKQLAKVAEYYKDKPTLIVSESVASIGIGAHIGLYIEESKLSFTVNVPAAKQTKLEFSSELLKLAKKPKEQKGKDA